MYRAWLSKSSYGVGAGSTVVTGKPSRRREGCFATSFGTSLAAYEERSLPAGTLEARRLAILADALEDAGCRDQEVLNHLRQPGEHWRGCHALDLLLGKE